MSDFDKVDDKDGYKELVPRTIDLENMKQSLKDSDQAVDLYGRIDEMDEM